MRFKLVIINQPSSNMPNFQIELFPNFQAMHGMDRAKQYRFEIRI